MFNKIIKIGGSVVIALRAGSIFGEEDIGIFIVKGIFLITFFVIAYYLLTSKRTRKFLKEVRKFW